MSKKLDKHDIKAPDAFVSFSDHVLSWMEKHFMTMIGLALIALVGAAGYMGYGYWQSTKESSAAEALQKPESDLRKMEEGLASKDPKAVAKAPEFSKEYLPSIEKIKSELKAHSNTKAALVSAMNLSLFLIQQKQFDQALEVISIPTYKPSDKNVLSAFWNMHRGLVLIEAKKYKEATDSYQEVLKSASLKYFHPEALLKLGVALELQGDKAKARDTYEKLNREFPGSEASLTGQQYLRLLDMKS